MIAMGGRPWQTASQRTQWVELKHADAALVHPVKKRLRHRERTETIVDDVDLDDATLLRDQGLGELASDRIAGELIGLEVDVVVSGLVGLGNLLLLVSDILHRLSYPIKRPIILAV